MVNSSEGLLRGRVFSRTYFRLSLTPDEEGPINCSMFRLKEETLKSAAVLKKLTLRMARRFKRKLEMVLRRIMKSLPNISK